MQSVFAFSFHPCVVSYRLLRYFGGSLDVFSLDGWGEFDQVFMHRWDLLMILQAVMSLSNLDVY